MIGYPIARAELEKLIEKERKGWLSRAQARTKKFRAAGKYQKETPIWGEVKRLYMRHQGEGKCAYCERKLELDLGGTEQDVEHYRPKGNVKAWKASAKLANELKRMGLKVTVPTAADAGYYLLPYHIHNYAAACKPCNETLKRDHFPIGGKYQVKGEDPKTLVAEKPYLIYPLGDFETLPEKLVRFRGVSPQPASTDPYERARALVTIEFFKLDDPARAKSLILQRARMISLLMMKLEKEASGGAGAAKAGNFVKKLMTPRAEHANCARSFAALYKRSPAKARALAEAAENLVDSMS